uniref:alpha-N-acetylgalactosaminide alpha-2,6-sialyltransferase n=1 Tax=Mola mola TaxID=94237 RepID=A0A3Q3WE66_MOLML
MSCDLFPAHPQILFCSRSSSPDWEEPVDKMSDSEGSTHPPPTSTSTSTSASTSASALHPSAHTTHPPRTVSKGPVPRPPQPTQAARPTEPPFIGDTYMSEDIPPQTACPDGVRGHVNNTEHGRSFLPGIPVLQWAPHATREQYQRLSRYPGAHGWQGVDYNMLVETLSVLNSSANRQLLDDWKRRGDKSVCIRCAVVGNGGILKDSKKGKEIDSHHYVFRTNGAIIKGFEQDVGSRTTHYTFSTNTLMNSMRSYAGAGYRGPPVSEETRYVFLPDHDRDYLLMKAAATHTRVERGPEQGQDPSKYFGEGVSGEELKMYHPDFIQLLHVQLSHPAFESMSHICTFVSAYGFMTPDYKNYSDHYYDSSYHQVGFFINHDLRMEMNLWQQLHQTGLMRLYMHE